MPFREDVDNTMIVDAQRCRRYRYSSKLALTSECKATIDKMMSFDAVQRPVSSPVSIVFLAYSNNMNTSDYFPMWPSALVRSCHGK
jgi:hypothetical protein